MKCEEAATTNVPIWSAGNRLLLLFELENNEKRNGNATRSMSTRLGNEAKKAIMEPRNPVSCHRLVNDRPPIRPFVVVVVAVQHVITSSSGIGEHRFLRAPSHIVGVCTPDDREFQKRIHPPLPSLLPSSISFRLEVCKHIGSSSSNSSSFFSTLRPLRRFRWHSAASSR